MKANELLKKLSNKLLGKKASPPAVDQVPLDEKAPAWLDRLGVIQLHPNWRN